jgi:hypothetical protein
MDNKSIIESATKLSQLQTESYKPLFPYPMSESNHRLVREKNLEQFTSYFYDRRKTANCFQQLDNTRFNNIVTQKERSITNGFLHLRE